MQVTLGCLKQIISEMISDPDQGSLTLVPRKKLPRALYHATSVHNVESIMKVGIEPRPGEARQHPLLRGAWSFFMDDLEGAAEMYAGGIGKSDPVAVFEVDVRKLPKSVNFYYDEDTGKGGLWLGGMEEQYAYCTQDTVPASALRLVEGDEGDEQGDSAWRG